jgi:hypothetical protein
VRLGPNCGASVRVRSGIACAVAKCVGLAHENASNLEASTAWYGELLGMVELFSHRNDERGIPHSGISEHEMWDVLVFRDPDNVQLEFIYLKPAAANLLGN